jgi:hypothetical protein
MLGTSGFERSGGRYGLLGSFGALAVLLLAGFAACASASAAGAAAADGAVLTWAAPTTNVDGSALTDLIGFNVYHGTSPANMMMAASLAATVRTYAESSLTPAVWYWYVTAVNAVGTESAPSAMVTKTLAAPAPPVTATTTAPPPAATTTTPPPATTTPAPTVVASAADAMQAAVGKDDADDTAGNSATATADARGRSRWSQGQQRTLCRPRGTVDCFRAR